MNGLQTVFVTGRFKRPATGIVWEGKEGWQSHGGPTQRHPLRALPSSLSVPIQSKPSQRLVGVSVVGVFSLYGGPDNEQSGAVGASLLLQRSGKVVYKKDLSQGRHYSDGLDLTPLYRLNGDGTMVESVGEAESQYGTLRVDRLYFEVPGGIEPDALLITDSGTPASMVVFDVTYEFAEIARCPFKGHSNQVALGEVGSILRMRDRHRLDESIHQLCNGLRACGTDIDEARGLSLTFLAAIVTATIEMGAPRSVHKALLDFARTVEPLADLEEIVVVTVENIYQMTDGIVGRTNVAEDPLIDQALRYVSRNFARNIGDEEVAKVLNLSTSHFRHLFRQATKQPFHKYMITLRLEKARELLVQSELPVNEVASAVGFLSPAHFSRAFVKRFGVPPSAVREARR